MIYTRFIELHIPNHLDLEYYLELYGILPMSNLYLVNDHNHILVYEFFPILEKIQVHIPN